MYRLPNCFLLVVADKYPMDRTRLVTIYQEPCYFCVFLSQAKVTRTYIFDNCFLLYFSFELLKLTKMPTIAVSLNCFFAFLTKSHSF